MKSLSLIYTSSFFFGLFLLGSFVGGCTRSVTVKPPVSLQTTQATFSSDQSAVAALTSVYSQMMSIDNFSLASGGLTLYPGLSADELINTSPDVNYDAFYANLLQPVATSALDNQLWRPAYSFIYQANAVIEGLDAATGVSPAVKQQLLGEAKFVRAFCHFYLRQLFGDVPLITSTDYRVNGVLPRTPVAQVDAQINKDLADATGLLTESYPSSGRVRPNKWTATALAARLALYQERWADAEAGATAILQSGLYRLEPDLNQVFLAGSREAIWQLMPVIDYYGNNTLEGLLFVPYDGSTIPSFTIHPALLAAFEAGDKRKADWIGLNQVGGQNYYYPYKYKVADNAPSAPLEYSIVFRLAEIFLIRAEARAHLNDLSGALADLDSIRVRAGLPVATAADLPSLLGAIGQERRVELCYEWGHRWLDLKRTDRIDAVLGPEKPAWQAVDSLYPIPGQEILANPFLTQNPGYPGG